MHFVYINLVSENVCYVIPIKNFLNRKREDYSGEMTLKVFHLNKISVSLNQCGKSFHCVVSQIDDVRGQHPNDELITHKLEISKKYNYVTHLKGCVYIYLLSFKICFCNSLHVLL